VVLGLVLRKHQTEAQCNHGDGTEPYGWAQYGGNRVDRTHKSRRQDRDILGVELRVGPQMLKNEKQPSTAHTTALAELLFPSGDTYPGAEIRGRNEEQLGFVYQRTGVRLGYR